MEQQVTQEDILLITFLVGLAEQNLGNILVNMDNGNASLNDVQMDMLDTKEAEERNKFERAKQVLVRFGLQ